MKKRTGGKSFGKPGRFSKDSDGKKPFAKRKSFGDKEGKKAFSGKRSFGEKRDGDNYGDRKKSFSSDKSYGDKKPFRKYGDDKPSYGAKRGYKKSDSDSGYGDKKPFRKYGDDKPSYGAKRGYKKSDSDSGYGDKKPFRKYGDDKPSYGAKRGYKKSGGDADYGDKKPFRKYGDDKPSYGAKRGYKKSGGDADYGDKKPFRKYSDDKPSYGAKRGYKKSGDDSEHGDKKPFRKYGDDKPSYGEKKSYGAKPYTRSKRKSEGEEAEDGGWQVFDTAAESRSFRKKSTRRAKPESSFDADGKMRLNKYIANSGVCSRREADELIKVGAVTVNGKVVTEMGFKIGPGDVVHYGGELLRRERNVYVLLNKPKDYITTTDDPQQRKTVMELVKEACRERIVPVGRLDRNTTGLLLLTNDGELATRLTHPKYDIRKIYHITLDKNLRPEDLQAISDGVELEDGRVSADEITFVGDGSDRKEVGMAIHSGRNRIVRRIFEHLGYSVIRLDRVGFAGLTKKDLPRGHWRFLSETEVGMLKMSAGGFEGKKKKRVKS